MLLLVIFGPPAVGKMTVGDEIHKLTGIPVFHNHLSIEPVLRFFPFGAPAFNRLVRNFRRSVFEEVAASDLPGLCFTFVWDLADEGDARFLTETCALFERQGAGVQLVELRASLTARLARNRSQSRLEQKPSKRNVENSERNLLAVETGHQLNSTGEIPLPFPHLVIDNTTLSAASVARQVVDHVRAAGRLD